MKKMLTKKIPLYIILILFAFLGILFCFFFPIQTPASDFSSEPTASNCNLNIRRLTGYSFIKPLVYAEQETGNPDYLTVKSAAQRLLDSKKAQGLITDGSIYYREFSGGKWFGINERVSYSPGSLLKVPELIAFYKMKERIPGLFEKKYLFNQEYKTDRNLHFVSKKLEVGKTYSIRDFLEYMIVHSDNQATIVLSSLIDNQLFSNVFTDIGFPSPDFKSKDYPMNARDYSRFFIELFNASYLNFEDSENCLRLLSKAVFKEGMMKGIPDGIPVCHKFGESGPETEPHFSEAGLVLNGNKPYLLVVMLKGKDLTKMPAVSSEISSLIYQRLGQ
ncbi:MAG: serine hydrolase [Ferruginibacter sp.]